MKRLLALICALLMTPMFGLGETEINYSELSDEALYKIEADVHEELAKRVGHGEYGVLLHDEGGISVYLSSIKKEGLGRGVSLSCTVLNNSTSTIDRIVFDNALVNGWNCQYAILCGDVQPGTKVKDHDVLWFSYTDITDIKDVSVIKGDLRIVIQNKENIEKDGITIYVNPDLTFAVSM